MNAMTWLLLPAVAVGLLAMLLLWRPRGGRSRPSMASAPLGLLPVGRSRPSMAAAPLGLLPGGRSRPSMAAAPTGLLPVGRWLRVFSGLLCMLLALALAGLGISLHQYLRMDTEVPVATLHARALGPQRFLVSLTDGNGQTREFEVLGDAWQVDAWVVRWRLPALLAGVPPLYRLDRLSGRYHDVERERTGARSAFALAGSGLPDLVALQQRFPQWLPFVDTRYGSGAFLPLIDNGQYEVTLHPRGGLVARAADAHTREVLGEPGE